MASSPPAGTQQTPPTPTPAAPVLTLEWQKESDLRAHYTKQIERSNNLYAKMSGYVAHKMKFSEDFTAAMLSGISSLQMCFGWCESVWNSTKKTLEQCVDKDEELAKHHITHFVGDFTGEGKNKEKERDIHIGEKNNMVENYMIEVLELLDQHKLNHQKKVIDSTMKIRNSIIKDFNAKFLDFKGTHFPKFKKSRLLVLDAHKAYKSFLSEADVALKKLKYIVESQVIPYKQGLTAKKDPVKALIRCFVRVQLAYDKFHEMCLRFVDCWKGYSEALVDMNATIHKNLIYFYEELRGFAFPAHPAMQTNIFDNVKFEPDIAHNYLESVFKNAETQLIKKYTQKDGAEGFLEAAHSEKLRFFDNFRDYVGVCWVDKQLSSNGEGFLFICISEDLFLNVFACANVAGEMVPTGKAIISDTLQNIKTKVIDWKREFSLSGKQPGSWFSAGKAACIMNDETEVKQLDTLIKEGANKLKAYKP